jgi:hypothetical protein
LGGGDHGGDLGGPSAREKTAIYAPLSRGGEPFHLTTRQSLVENRSRKDGVLRHGARRSCVSSVVVAPSE